MRINNEKRFETIEDYVAFWQVQSLETLRAIAAEHMGGYKPTDTKNDLILAITKGMAEWCQHSETE